MSFANPVSGGVRETWPRMRSCLERRAGLDGWMSRSKLLKCSTPARAPEVVKELNAHSWELERRVVARAGPGRPREEFRLRKGRRPSDEPGLEHPD